MSEIKIIFSPRAEERLEEIADYLFKQNLSNEFVISYLKRFETWLNKVLTQFPESGTPMPEYGENIRRIVYQKYSFLYRYQNNLVEVLTVYRENRP